MSLLTLTGFRRSRCKIAGRARVRSVHGEIEGEVIDLSLSGVNLAKSTEAAPPIGHPVGIELRCGPAPGIAMSMRGRVVRCLPGQLAVRFEPLSPLLERELQALMDAHGILRDDTDGR